MMLHLTNEGREVATRDGGDQIVSEALGEVWTRGGVPKLGEKRVDD